MKKKVVCFLILVSSMTLPSCEKSQDQYNSRGEETEKCNTIPRGEDCKCNTGCGCRPNS